MKTRRLMRFLAVFLTAIMLFNAAEFLTIDVSAAPASYTDISAGETKTVRITSVGQNVYFRFVPQNSGTYTFYSTGSYDTYGYLLDASDSQLASNDDGGEGYNFSFTYNLTKGTTYYIKTRMYGSSTTGSFSVTVRFDSIIVDDPIIINGPIEITEGANTYSLFNSGVTSSSGYDKYEEPNPAPNTYTNNGYDLFGNIETAASRSFILGLSFTVNTNVTEQATLNINAYDVDEDIRDCGYGYERDYIYLVDETSGSSVKLDGHMSGTNNTWRTSIFRIDPSLFQFGHTYHFELHMTCTGSHSCYYYSVTVRNVSLIVNGQGNNSEIPYADLEASISAGGQVSTRVSVRATESGTYLLEYKAVYANTGNQRGGSTSSVTISTTDTVFNSSFRLESGSLTGTYIITLFIKNSLGNVVATREVTVSWDGVAVSYNSNGGSQNIPLDTTAYTEGDTVNVRFDLVPSLTDYLFLGWSTDRNATVPEFKENGNTSFVIGDSDVTLYAVWGTAHEHSYTVTIIEPTCTSEGSKVYVCDCGDSYSEPYGTIPPHTPGDWIIDSPATCAAPGSKHIECTVCGAVISEETIPAPPHNYTPFIVEPTCTSDGFIVYTCSCGDSYAEDYLPMIPHTHVDWVIDVPATCTTSGSKHSTCTECGNISYVYIPALGHDYVTEVTKEVTCTTPGITTHTCVNCGDSYLTYIYSEHSYSITDTKAPSCDEDGYTTYTCANCGDSYNEVIPGEHDYVAEITKVATATEDGVITYTCSICGDKYIETIPARPEAKVLLIQDRLPWTENNNVSLLDKMVADGYLTGWDMTTTSNFNAVDLAAYSVVLIANDQNTATYNRLREIQNSLVQFANAGGVVIYGACDHGWASGDIGYLLPENVTKANFYSRYNYIVDADHPVVTGVNTDGRSLTNTLLYGNYCSHTAFFDLPENANIILQDGHGDPTLVEYSVGDGHIILSGLTWEFYYVRNAYDGRSNTTYTRNVYDDLVYYAVTLSDPCDHIYDDGVVVEPTCVEQGYTLHTCSVCGNTMKDNFVDAPGHTEGEWEIVENATATENGLKAIFCTVCGDKIMEEVIPMTDSATVTITSEYDTVMVGQTFDVYVTVSDCDPVKSFAFVPVFDDDIFELVSAEWIIPATIQVTEPEMVSAWMSATDINGDIIKLTLRAADTARNSTVSAEALVQDTGVITLSVVSDFISVIECTHDDMEISSVDGTYHVNICAGCGYNYLSVHTFDHACDAECNECDYMRVITHVESDLLLDDNCHWYECLVCGEVLTSEEHIWDNSCDTDCNVCGCIREITHTPAAEMEFDENEHWLNCSVCGETLERHSHIFDGDNDAICNNCPYCRLIRGDVSGDGILDSDDAIALLLYVYAPDDYPLNQSGDMDGDGDVDSDDAIRILLYIYFPEEYPLSMFE